LSIKYPTEATHVHHRLSFLDSPDVCIDSVITKEVAGISLADIVQ